MYLANAPQANQEDLSHNLTSLLTEVVRACGSNVPKFVYVTDAGKIETAYWKNVLRKFFVDGVRIPIVRVVDYYHASERLTTIAEALKLDANNRTEWLSRMRKTLLEPGGHGRVLRSIAHMKATHGYKSALVGDAQKAETYLRRYKRFMDYDGARSQGFPDWQRNRRVSLQADRQRTNEAIGDEMAPRRSTAGDVASLHTPEQHLAQSLW